MLTKNEIKFIKNLAQKKFRQTEGLFVAEGKKLVQELLQSDYKLFRLYALPQFMDYLPTVAITQINEDELHKISNLVTPNEVVAIFYIKNNKIQSINDLTLILDDINDPGNLGTIIRLCDWFGVHQIICSENTVDCYNPKVVQATMGSLARVNVVYANILKFIEQTDVPIFATTLSGNNIYQLPLPQKALIIMGNEANGVSKKIMDVVQNHLTIPPFNENSKTESLNVANATAIILSEWRRR